MSWKLLQIELEKAFEIYPELISHSGKITFYGIIITDFSTRIGPFLAYEEDLLDRGFNLEDRELLVKFVRDYSLDFMSDPDPWLDAANEICSELTNLNYEGEQGVKDRLMDVSISAMLALDKRGVFGNGEERQKVCLFVFPNQGNIPFQDVINSTLSFWLNMQEYHCNLKY